MSIVRVVGPASSGSATGCLEDTDNLSEHVSCLGQMPLLRPQLSPPLPGLLV